MLLNSSTSLFNRQALNRQALEAVLSRHPPLRAHPLYSNAWCCAVIVCSCWLSILRYFLLYVLALHFSYCCWLSWQSASPRLAPQFATRHHPPRMYVCADPHLIVGIHLLVILMLSDFLPHCTHSSFISHFFMNIYAFVFFFPSGMHTHILTPSHTHTNTYSIQIQNHHNSSIYKFFRELFA